MEKVSTMYDVVQQAKKEGRRLMALAEPPDDVSIRGVDAVLRAGLSEIDAFWIRWSWFLECRGLTPVLNIASGSTWRWVTLEHIPAGKGVS